MERMNLECRVHNDCAKRIYWSPIIAGVLVAIGLTILFNVFTLGIGLSAAPRNETGAENFAMGSFVWLFIGTYITLFFAGWVAGNLVKYHTSSACQGVLYGFLVWTLTLIIYLMLSASASNADIFNLSKMARFLSLREVHKIGIATLSVFFILFMGALGSCCGGYFGVKFGKRTLPPETVTLQK